MNSKHSSLTEILEVDPDLVHTTGVRPAEHHTLGAVEADPLELCVTLLASPGPRHPAHPDLVADHLDTLPALDQAPDNLSSLYILNAKKHV